MLNQRILGICQAGEDRTLYRYFAKERKIQFLGYMTFVDYSSSSHQSGCSRFPLL